MQSSSIILPEFFEALANMVQIDMVDWELACQFAEHWKLSVADALLDLRFVDETILAKALAKAHNLNFVPGANLRCDFSSIDFETFQDLLSVGAVPLEDEKLAICNPYDDLRGNLGNRLCQREWIVTERSMIFSVLRERGVNAWFEGSEA